MPFNALYKISPELVLKILFRFKQGYPLNLKEPKTYNEKLQWIKLYDKNEWIPKCCDKYTVRRYVEEQGCGKLLNHLIWQGFAPEEIPFENLPKKYVIKITHGSTFNIIQDGHLLVTPEEIIKKCRKWLKAKFLPCYGEWFYGIERPRIIIEDLIESHDDEPLKDYKVFCFNGVPRLIGIDSDRSTAHKKDLYDTQWRKIPNAKMKYPNSDKVLPKPKCLSELLNYAAILSRPFTHARVDFYIVDEKIYFGEITFTPGAGFDRFSPHELDLLMGSWLQLPSKP